jgi:hypothetical protein
VQVRVELRALGAGVIEELKHAIEEFPGPAEVLLLLDTAAGTRRLRLGEAYRVKHTPALLAELAQVLEPRRELIAATA